MSEQNHKSKCTPKEESILRRMDLGMIMVYESSGKGPGWYLRCEYGAKADFQAEKINDSIAKRMMEKEFVVEEAVDGSGWILAIATITDAGRAEVR